MAGSVTDTGSRQIAGVEYRRARLVPEWVIPWIDSRCCRRGALDNQKSRDLKAAECASTSTTILYNSPLQSVTGVWSLWEKEQLSVCLLLFLFDEITNKKLLANQR